MIVHDEYEQGSVQWLQARAGIPTASEFGSLVTPEFKIRTGETPKNYLALKLAERWTGMPVNTFNSFAMEQGTILEPEARPWFELETGIVTRRVGLCTTDDGKIGCSPDGLIDSDSGIEIKCPQPNTHVKYLLEGTVPKEYLHQVHGSILVTGATSWRFLSYRRGFPPLLLTVNRDEEIIDKLNEALSEFLTQFESGWQKLCERNGGPPPKRKAFIPSPESEDNPYVDINP